MQASAATHDIHRLITCLPDLRLLCCPVSKVSEGAELMQIYLPV